jgi:hypothetical protein
MTGKTGLDWLTTAHLTALHLGKHQAGRRSARFACKQVDYSCGSGHSEFITLPAAMPAIQMLIMTPMMPSSLLSKNPDTIHSAIEKRIGSTRALQPGFSAVSVLFINFSLVSGQAFCW